MWLEIIVDVAGVVGLASWSIVAWPLVRGLLRPRFLSRARGDFPMDVPRVSVIVPACNEDQAIRACLVSLTAQDYDPLEIIAVDDRSSDGTGRIMDDLAARDHRISVLHIQNLPTGWLGKNHANWTGATQAKGTWLLFTDGDILFEPQTIRLAVIHAESERLDHLCLFPGLICEGYFEKAAVCFFGLVFSAALKLWQVRNPLVPQSFCGVGAFNLVRADAYRAIGTHARMRMEVADDVKLGKLLKQKGFVTDILAAWPELSVRWQKGFRGVVNGLEKNGFAGSDYRLGRTTYRVVAVMLLAVLPIVGAVFAPGLWRLPYALWWASEVAVLAMAARQQRFSWTVGLAFPIAAFGVAFAVGRSTLLTLWRRGIIWRGTFYSLRELRQGVV